MKITTMFISFFSNREKTFYFISLFLTLGASVYFFFKKKSLEQKRGKDTPYKIRISLTASFYKFLLLFSVLFSFFLISLFLLRIFDISLELEKLISCFLLFCIFYSLFRFFKYIEDDFYQNKKKKAGREEKTKAAGFFLFAKCFICFLSLLSALHVFEVNLHSVLAIGGIGGVFFGMAAKDFLSNVFSGMMLFVDGHFSIGDYIEGQKDIKGRVEHIGTHCTLLRTNERTLVSVPNRLFSQMIINNLSRKDYSPIEITFPVKVEKMEKLLETFSQMRSIVQAEPEIDGAKEVQIFLKGFEEGELHIALLAYAKISDDHQVEQMKQHLYLRIRSLLESQRPIGVSRI